MPIPNEHALRLEKPDYDRYRRTHGGVIYGGMRIPNIIDIIWGHNVGEPINAWHPQALRFPVKYWKNSDAKEWIRRNISDYISYEPASETKQ